MINKWNTLPNGSKKFVRNQKDRWLKSQSKNSCSERISNLNRLSSELEIARYQEVGC